MADGDRDARRPHTFEHRVLTQIGARHRVAHLGQRDGDGAHSRPADADDVRAAQSESSCESRGANGGVRSRWTRCYGHTVDQTGQGTTAVDRAAVVGRLRQQFARQRVGPEPVDARARGSPNSASSSMTAAFTSVNQAMLSRWWSSAAPGHGTRIDGMPVTATSCTVDAASPADQQIGRGVAPPACSARTPPLGARCRRRHGRAIRCSARNVHRRSGTRRARGRRRGRRHRHGSRRSASRNPANRP